jgi:taurine dioxygenase
MGGDTLWASMSAVYESLSPGWKSDLEDLYAIHDMGTFRNDYLRKGGVAAVDKALAEVGSAVHPVIASHPVTGLKYLNVNQSFTRNIVDLTQGSSDEILQYLYQHVRRPEFQVRFRWENDSVAIWDNRITQHYAVCDYLPSRRHMQRVTINNDRRVVG